MFNYSFHYGASRDHKNKKWHGKHPYIYFAKPYGFISSFLYASNSCFGRKNGDLSLRKSKIGEILLVMNGELDKTIIEDHNDERYRIEVYKDRSKIIQNTEGEGEPRHELHPDLAEIPTEDVLRMMEDWYEFLQEASKYTFVDKTWVKEEYKDQV